jgi:prepilin-type N-terminal cleavage/methylation domain-containing protein/prepilin-type processing-associated H-X9-DG protein
MNMRKKAFTLIELLVVIAIIAMLLAILVPALQTAKQTAGAAVCQSNEKQILNAWIIYAEENHSKLCGSGTQYPAMYPEASMNADDSYYDWVASPVTADGTAPTSGKTVEDEIRGIERGSLYPYYKVAKLTHCPLDNRYRKSPTNPAYGGDGGYRTYSFILHANQHWDPYYQTSGWAVKSEIFHKLSEFKNSGSKFVLVEENDNRGFNEGSWVMVTTTGSPSFVDPFAVIHNKRSILGFADGHAEKQVWKDPDTMQYSDDITTGKRTTFGFSDPGNVDLEWLANHYPKKKY